MANLINFKAKVNLLDQAMKETAEALTEKIDILLPSHEKGRSGERRLFEAMRYSTLSAGKRLRPFLVVHTANLFGVSKSSSLQAAAALEFIHAYSLIHDDLPAIDNDDFRRGQPSSHKKFDEATAILAGDALLTYSFEVLSDITTHPDTMVRCELVQSYAKASGPKGMVAGQMMDLMSDNQEMTLEEIAHIQRLKTCALISTACEAGAILGKAPRPLRNALKGYAQDVGLAFQITDDILDAKSAKDKDNARDNKSEGKPTFVSVMGIEKATAHTRMLCEQAISHLEVFDKKADLLRELAKFIVDRQY